MTENAITFVQMLFNTAYSLFTGFYIPGLVGVTPLGLLLGSASAIVAVKFIKGVLQDGDK